VYNYEDIVQDGQEKDLGECIENSIRESFRRQLDRYLLCGGYRAIQ
jgi:hypothetical protein